NPVYFAVTSIRIPTEPHPRADSSSQPIPRAPAWEKERTVNLPPIFPILPYYTGITSAPTIGSRPGEPGLVGIARTCGSAVDAGAGGNDSWVIESGEAF